MALVLVVIVLANRDWIAQQLVERQIRTATGMEPEMGGFSFGLMDPKVTLDNFRLYNPAEFGGVQFLQVPELHIDYDRDALRRHEIHIRFMRVNLQEMDVVKNAAGATNIISFANTLVPRASGGGRTFAPFNGYKFTGIDLLNLSIGKVKFVDLKDQQRNRVVAIGYENLIYTNVLSTADLHGLSAKLWFRGAHVAGLPVHPPKGDTSAQALGPTP